MAGTDNKTTAPVAPTAPAASGALQAFNNSADGGGAQVYVGKSSILGYGSV